MHQNSILIFRKYLLRFFTDGWRVLELGPDGDPSTYRREVTNHASPATRAPRMLRLSRWIAEDGRLFWGAQGRGSPLTYRMSSDYAIEAPARDVRHRRIWAGDRRRP